MVILSIIPWEGVKSRDVNLRFAENVALPAYRDAYFGNQFRQANVAQNLIFTVIGIQTCLFDNQQLANGVDSCYNIPTV